MNIYVPKGIAHRDVLRWFSYRSMIYYTLQEIIIIQIGYTSIIIKTNELQWGSPKIIININVLKLGLCDLI